jgi:hypothetical protein
MTPPKTGGARTKNLVEKQMLERATFGTIFLDFENAKHFIILLIYVH